MMIVALTFSGHSAETFMLTLAVLAAAFKFVVPALTRADQRKLDERMERIYRTHFPESADRLIAERRSGRGR